MQRRFFLQTSLTAGGALLLGFHLRGKRPAGASPASVELNGFVRIAPDNRITIMASRPEIGQGVKTSVPLLIAEELDADWSDIQVEQAPFDPQYGDQFTGGSDAMRSNFLELRKVGAAARALLVKAAAARWKIPESDCLTEKSHVLSRTGNRRLSYGELAAEAAKLPAPQNPPLKDPSAFRLIGTSVPDPDTPAIVTGKPLFGLDIQLPGMLYACIAKPPRFGANVISVNDARARAVPGVKQIVRLQPHPTPGIETGGVAVVATSTWAAMKGRNALEITWSEGDDPTESSEGLRKKFETILSSSDLTAVRQDGDVQTALGGAAKRVEADYELPFLAHVTMEPQNYTAWVRKDRCELWGSTQVPDTIMEYATMLTGLSPSAIKIHLNRSGGGFGRRLNADYAADALLVSKETGTPVQVVWTREDDLLHDFYRPAGMYRIAAGLDADGRLTAWHMKAATTSRYAFRKADRSPHITEVFPDELPAGFVPHFRLDYRNPPSTVPVGAWRAPGHNATAFVIQSMLDELAHAAGKDPLAFRLDLIGDHEVMKYRDHGGDYDARELRAVLQLAADKAGWGKPLEKGRYQGLSAHVTFGVPVAEVAEISVDGSGGIRVHKITAAVDCGQVINRNGARQQVAGAILDGLGAALYGQVTIEKAAARQTNFHQYRMLRMSEAPEVEVHLVESRKAPKGLGEMGLPPVAAAVCNAVFAATGRRIRRLPLLSNLS
ncbi:xanthine dehydrogenase family protein molybdopterin-binding subunit [Larkinella soli]|uniref:xanthine dehydrogenase family protein molybdopterin-binding subunit n=1 Tax=Larkinella soli TaxID=1770527 RepID=UPI0013E3DF95|nr:xanthine dehydrogenase family protein molybdopterin-binding subunit [Larkinella soli]